MFFLLTKKIKIELKVKLSRLLIQFYKYFKQYNWIEFFSLVFFFKQKNYNVLLIEFKSHVELNLWFGSNYTAKKNRYNDQKRIISRDFVIIFNGS